MAESRSVPNKPSIKPRKKKESWDCAESDGSFRMNHRAASGLVAGTAGAEHPIERVKSYLDAVG